MTMLADRMRLTAAPQVQVGQVRPLCLRSAGERTQRAVAFGHNQRHVPGVRLRLVITSRFTFILRIRSNRARCFMRVSLPDSDSSAARGILAVFLVLAAPKGRGGREGAPPWSLRWRTRTAHRPPLPTPATSPLVTPAGLLEQIKRLPREGASIKGNADAMTRRLKPEERTRHFHTITCRHCGRRRRVERENAKYCSGKCKQAAFRDRRRRSGSRNDEWTGKRLHKADREVGKVVVPTAVTRSPESEAERGFQKACFRDPRQEMPPRRKSPQKVPPDWLGAQPGDYLGEISMYAWPA